MNKMISIIVPFCNDEKNAEKCLESILCQTYTNFEVLCVNESNADTTLDTIKQYMKKDSRVKFINNLKDPSRTYNVAIDEACGDFIQFIDSSDCVISTTLENMMNKMIEANTDIVVCDCIYENLQIENNNESFTNVIKNNFTKTLPWNKLYKKEFIIKNIDETFNFSEQDLFVKLKEKFGDELASKVSYSQVFDFTLWKMLVLDSNSVDYPLHLEMKEVFKAPQFIESLTLKEKFGVSYNPDLSYSNELIEKFAILCSDANQDISDGKLDLVPFHVVLCLFVKLFIVKNGIKLNTNDLIANVYQQLDGNITQEAQYVNQILK